jgi:glycosyltransferase involved in cell wall biosynthesis
MTSLLNPNLSGQPSPQLAATTESAPRKISILVSDLSTRGAGRWGGAVRPFLLAQALQQIGWAVELVGFTAEGEAAVTSTPEMQVKSVALRPYPQFFRSVQALFNCIEGDIIYAYKPKPSSFGVGLLHKFRTGKPLILDIDDWELSWHGGDSWHYRPTLKQLARDLLKPDGALRQPDHPLYLQWIERWVSCANQVTVHTQFLQSRFGGAYVPNGKNVELFTPHQDSAAMRERYGLAGYRILMFPGAPRPYKGVEDVLQALDLLDEPDLKLVIVGGSPYDDYDSQLMQQWGHRLIQLSKIAHDQMPDVIAAADVIVVPQRDVPAAQAQFPLKLTDGMAMAKPILATRVGDIPKILGETGYLVDPESPQQIADKLRWIFAHPEAAAQKGQQARQRCVAHYSITAMANQLSALIAIL